jgi:hypothetical protein
LASQFRQVTCADTFKRLSGAGLPSQPPPFRRGDEKVQVPQ